MPELAKLLIIKGPAKLQLGINQSINQPTNRSIDQLRAAKSIECLSMLLTAIMDLELAYNWPQIIPGPGPVLQIR